MKLILIISDEYDGTTSDVCRCLKYLNQNFLRINPIDDVKIKNFHLFDENEITLNCNGTDFKLKDVVSFWHRRGTLNIESPELTNTQKQKRNIFSYGAAIRQVQKDHSRIRDYLFTFLMKRVPTLGNYFKRHNNKLLDLSLARQVGLTTPETIIETSKSRLEEFIKKYPSGIITKIISDPEICTIKKDSKLFGYNFFTNKIQESDLANFPDSFSPSLFQPLISKKADIRVFFINSKIYSMAILSQSDKQTSVDFRRYNHKIPNRKVPFKVPQSVENSIRQLMHKIELNTGSIDFIYGTDDKFYFLEVNPVGQFGMVSEPCNYYLEMEVAKFLSGVNLPETIVS